MINKLLIFKFLLKQGGIKCLITLGHEINIPAQAEADTPDLEAECIQDLVAGRIPDLVGGCTRVLEADCIPAQGGVYTPVPGEDLIRVRAGGSTRVLEADCIPAQGGVYIRDPAVACTRDLVRNHIEVTYHLGQCSLLILRNTECRIKPILFALTCLNHKRSTAQ